MGYVKKEFLKLGDKGATLGMKKKEPHPEYGMVAECPGCKGYGGWHLTLNAYGKGKHFDCSCGNCNGWGYVAAEDAGHIHEFTEMSVEKVNALRAGKNLPAINFTYGNCCHNAVCTLCGAYRFTDSSD